MQEEICSYISWAQAGYVLLTYISNFSYLWELRSYYFTWERKRNFEKIFLVFKQKKTQSLTCLLLYQITPT